MDTHQINRVFNDHPELFPLGYQFMGSRKIDTFKVIQGISHKHNSFRYFTRKSYKPISDIYAAG